MRKIKFSLSKITELKKNDVLVSVLFVHIAIYADTQKLSVTAPTSNNKALHGDMVHLSTLKNLKLNTEKPRLLRLYLVYFLNIRHIYDCEFLS